MLSKSSLRRLFPLLVLVFILPIIVYAQPVRVGLVYHADQSDALSGGVDKLAQYRMAVERNGGRVSFLCSTDPKLLNQLRFEQIDALLLPGGVDVDPAMYGEQAHIKLENTLVGLDAFETEVVQVCLKRGVPILGICRGHQFLNVYFGGSLYQDIPSQLKAKTSATHRIRVKGVSQPCWHEITILPDTRLFSIMGTSKYNVNSYHHQGVKRLGKGLEAVSYSADGLVEAIEGAGARRGTPQGYLLGVQFHPEKNLKDPAMNRIIKSFIEAGHEFRKLRN